MLKGRQQHVLHRITGGIDGNLGDESQPPACGNGHLAAVIVQFTSENAQQGGLAGAVFAQQSHPLAGAYLKGNSVQYFCTNLKFLNQI
ncbi:hypothetical protein SDC9_136007 [bioreactor metagenome]|uniref:Uncharacterized protein n=1 Tax=bioreactor metagenome TaxID=1076179 RepID=A0A645DJA4_9ZZZZ